MAEPPKRDPEYRTQQEARAQAGETLEAQGVINTVIAARAVPGVTIELAIQATNFARLSDLEKAWIQRQLRDTHHIELPEALRVDEGVLDQALEQARRAREAAARPEREAAVEITQAQIVENGVEFVESERSEGSVRRGDASFLVEDAIGKFIKRLSAERRAVFGDNGVTLLWARLKELKFEDIKVEGAEEAAGAVAGGGAGAVAGAEGGPVAGPIVGRPPEAAERAPRKRKEFRRFEYQGGRLIEVFNYESEDEEQREQARGMALPEWFAKIAGDPAKVQRCLEALAELYRNLHPRNLKVVPLREGRRRGAPITGFRLQFIDSREDRPLPEEAAILQRVNAAEHGGKKYYEAEGFDDWKDAQRRRIVEEYRREKIEAQQRELLGAAPVPAAGPARAEAAPAPPAPGPAPEAAPAVAAVPPPEVPPVPPPEAVPVVPPAGAVPPPEAGSAAAPPRVEALPPAPPPPIPERPRYTEDQVRFLSAAQEAWQALQRARVELAQAEQKLKDFDSALVNKIFGLWRGHVRVKLDIAYKDATRDAQDKERDYSQKLQDAAPVLGRPATDLRRDIEAGVAPAAPEEARPEAAGAAGPAPEHPPGIIPPSPERREGEGEDEYLTRWQRWKDGAKSLVFATPKFVWGVASTLLGIRLAQTTIQYWSGRRALKKEVEALAPMMQELERASLALVPAEPEGVARRTAEIQAKAGAMQARITQLVRDGRMSDAEGRLFAERLNKTLRERATCEEGARQEHNQEMRQILDDYFRRVKGRELAREGLSSGFLGAGLQFARGVTYAGLTAILRADKARVAYERSVETARLAPGGEARQPKFWEREKGVLRDITIGAVGDYLKGITGVFVDLVSGRRMTKAEWAQRKMSFGKALGTTMIFAGLAGVTHAEISESGFSPQAQIDRVLGAMERDGIAATIGNNYLHNVEQMSEGVSRLTFGLIPKLPFGLIRFGADGNLAIADHPDRGFAPPVAPTEAPPVTPEKVETDFFKAHPEYQRLEQQGLIDVKGHADGHVSVEIKLGVHEGGYRYAQQALRDLTIQELPISGKEFTTLDATHVENTVANLHLLLRGLDLRFLDSEQLDGVAHVAAGKLIIDDYAKFHTLMQETLLKHSGAIITAENLHRHVEAVATVNNTSDAHWQHDLNIKTGVAEEGTAGHIAEHLDHKFIHQAEIQVAQHAAADLGIEGARVDAAHVADEDSFQIQVGGQTIHVEDGQVVAISGTGYHEHLTSPVDLDNAYARAHLTEVLDRIQQTHAAPAAEVAAAGIDMKALNQQLTALEQPLQGAGLKWVSVLPKEGSADQFIFRFRDPYGEFHKLAIQIGDGKVVSVEGKSLAAPVDVQSYAQSLIDSFKPHTLADLLDRNLAHGGIVDNDGDVHFGAVRFEQSWLNEAGKQKVEAFVKDHARGLIVTSKDDAFQALALHMRDNPDTKAADVGDYVFRHAEDLLKKGIKPAPVEGRQLGI